MTKKAVVGRLLAILAGFFILLGRTVSLLYASAAAAGLGWIPTDRMLRRSARFGDRLLIHCNPHALACLNR